MNIFEKRPLCLILCIALCGFFIFVSDSILFRAILIALAFLPTIISFILRFSDSKQKLCRAISITLIISFFLSFIYFDKWFNAYEIYDEEIEIVGTVEEITLSNSYTTRLLVKVDSINDKRANGYKFFAYAKRADTAGIIYGTKIRFHATLTGFSDESRSYNISKGINAYASDVKNIEILEYTDGGIRGQLLYYREYLTRYIMSVTNTETGAILSALLLGERDYLPDQLRLDFKRIGISHILALSGMHLAILSLGLGKILSLLGLKKKGRLVLISLFVLMYMALTGFSVSVVRAGIMLILSSILFLLGRTKDSLTSLSVAVFVICAIHPYAVFDISLQLSALATFGLIVYSEYAHLENAELSKGRTPKFLSAGIMTSIFAISATIAISANSFGGFSVISPFATLIFSIIVEIVMYLGCITMAIGWLLPIGEAVVALCKILSSLVGAISSFEYVYVSLSFTVGITLVTIYTVIFFSFVIVKIKDKRSAVSVLIVLFSLLLIIPTVNAVKLDNHDEFAYLAEEKSDIVLFRSDRQTCLINSSQYSKNCAYSSLDLLEELQVSYLDAYYLTHYSWSIDDELKVILSNVLVDKIYLPTPRNEDEEAILKVIIKSVEDHRTNVYTFSYDQYVTVGNHRIELLYSEPYGNTSINAFMISGNGMTYTYLSSGIITDVTKEEIMNIISLSDFVIFGNHGKKYKDPVYIDSYFSKVKAFVVESENLLFDEDVIDEYNSSCGFSTNSGSVIYLK